MGDEAAHVENGVSQMDRGNQQVNGPNIDAVQSEVTAKQTRRRWSASEKACIIAESLVPGAKISRVARRYGMSVGLLSSWRCKAVAAQEAASSQSTPAFVPVVLKDDGLDRTSVRGSVGIEIAIADAVIRVNGAVDAAALRVVLSAVRGQA